MELKTGAKLGPYEILSRIGAGGMGQVWKARDTRLDRIVALKTSHEKFSERFEREARAVAALNHPHICTLYDVGPDYLVMEYIEGTEIKGPLALDQALKYAVQLASALEAAHRKLITHRDLKPANILIAKSGVKVLDFGLAKTEQTKEEIASAETLTRAALTQEGAIVGTLQYMAPEQLQGKPTDVRADIFSFGCVLYEMLTGKRAFDASNTASIIAAILERPSPSVGQVAPAMLDWTLRRCLAKDPDERWQSASDLRAALENAGQIGIQPTDPGRSRVPNRWLGAAAGVFALLAAVLALIHFREAPPPVEQMRFTMNPPANSAVLSPPFLSPDGRNLAFEALGPDGQERLWIRALDSLDTKPVGETVYSSEFFWSADSRFVAYVANSKLRKVDISTGSTQAICDSPVSFYGGTWNADGVILFGSDRGLQRVSASGGQPTAVTTSGNKTGRYHALPWFLPDGHHFLYLGVSSQNADSGQLYTGTLDATPDKQDYTPLLTSRSGAQYAAGQLLFVRENQLMAQPFDTSRRVLSGEPQVVADHIWTGQGATGYFSAGGTTLAYGVLANDGHLTWVDRQGVILSTVGAPGAYSDVSLSPNGKQIAAARDSEVVITDVERNVTSPFTSGPGQKRAPIWSPDGSRILFTLVRDGLEELVSKSVSGTTPDENLFKTDEPKIPDFLSPDGGFLVYTRQADRQSVWILPLTRDGKPAGPSRTLLNENIDVGQPQLSPDGRWEADTSVESGVNEIWVHSFPDANTKFLVSKGGGVEPHWRADGKELFYRRITGELVAVEVTPGAAFQIGASKVLFQSRFAGAPGIHNPAWSPSTDGKQFVGMIRTRQNGDDIPVTVLLNWQTGLKK